MQLRCAPNSYIAFHLTAWFESAAPVLGRELFVQYGGLNFAITLCDVCAGNSTVCTHVVSSSCYTPATLVCTLSTACCACLLPAVRAGAGDCPPVPCASNSGKGVVPSMVAPSLGSLDQQRKCCCCSLCWHSLCRVGTTATMVRTVQQRGSALQFCLRLTTAHTAQHTTIRGPRESVCLHGQRCSAAHGSVT